MKVLCVDVGGTDIKTSLWQNGARSGDIARTPSPEGVSELFEVLAGLWAESRPEFWSLALPGTVRPRRFWSRSGAFGVGEDEIDLREALSGYKVPSPDSLTNDVQAAAWGEYLSLGRPGRRVAVLNLGTGLGGGVVLDGRLAPGLAQEVGHIRYQGDRLCGCGRRGCLETRAGWRHLQEMSGLGAPSELRSSYEQGDEAAARLVKGADLALAHAACAVDAVLRPSQVIITGGTARALYGSGGMQRLQAIFEAQFLLAENTLLCMGVGDEAVSLGLFDLVANTQDGPASSKL